MFHKFEGWDKAPAGTTHFCVQECGTPWLKVDAEGNLWYRQVRYGPWRAYGKPADGHRHMVGAIARHEEPAKEGDKLMNMDKLKQTKAYEEIVAFVKLNHKGKFFDETVEAVCGRFIYEYNKRHPEGPLKELRNICVINSFGWAASREGTEYWSAIHSRLRHEVLPLIKVEKVVKVEEPKEEPKVDEDKLTLKAFKETEAYRTIKRFVERNGGNPAQLGSIVKKFMKNYEEQKNNAYPYGRGVKTWKDSFALEPSINAAFHWEKTPEGHDWWWRIDVGAGGVDIAAHLGKAKAAAPIVPEPAPVRPDAPVEMPKAKVEAPKVPEPKPAKVGWWG